MAKKKTARDREAGLVFSWRVRTTSPARWVIALAVSSAFWFLMVSFFRVEIKARAVMPADSMSLTVIDLNHEENQWLADIVERESPLANRWELDYDMDSDLWIYEVVQKELPAPYVPSYPEVEIANEEVVIQPYQDLSTWILPDAERVSGEVVESVVPTGLRIEKLDGGWDAVSLDWVVEEDGVAVGDVYFLKMGITMDGRVISCQSLGNGVANSEIEEIVSGLFFPRALNSEGIRWWEMKVEVTGSES